MIDRVRLNLSTDEPLNALHARYSARPSTPLLIVEGNEDERVYKEIFKGYIVIESKELSDKHRRQAVIDIMGSAYVKTWAKSIRGIVDKDLDITDEKIQLLNKINIFLTDNADLEMYALKEIKFYIALEEITSVNCSEKYTDICNMVIDNCSPLGAVRQVSANLDPPQGFEYENFDYQKTGKNPYISEISDRDQKVLIEETINGLSRFDSGRALLQIVDSLVSELEYYLSRADPSILVNSKMFNCALKRYLKENNLYRGNPLSRSDDRILQDARTFLKNNPETILNSPLGTEVKSLA